MTDNIEFILTSDPTVARKIIQSDNPPLVTIEAEYGSYVAEGTQYTAAHHQATGPYTNDNPSPCCDINIPTLNNGTVLVSHVDLDTVGGCLRTTNEWKEKLFNSDTNHFWQFAGWVDVKGPHMMRNFPTQTDKDTIINQLTAYWAWHDKNMGSLRTNQGESLDITKSVMSAANALQHILNNNPEYIDQGIEFQKKEAALAAESFRDILYIGDGSDKIKIVTRNSDKFTNHLYDLGENGLADIVIAYNNKYGSITLSYAQWEDRYMDLQIAPCFEIMQSIWGNTAGGHAGIAGSPRELRVEESMIQNVYAKLVDYRNNCLYEDDQLQKELAEIPF